MTLRCRFSTPSAVNASSACKKLPEHLSNVSKPLQPAVNQTHSPTRPVLVSVWTGPRSASIQTWRDPVLLVQPLIVDLLQTDCEDGQTASWQAAASTCRTAFWEDGGKRGEASNWKWQPELNFSNRRSEVTTVCWSWGFSQSWTSSKDEDGGGAAARPLLLFFCCFHPSIAFSSSPSGIKITSCRAESVSGSSSASLSLAYVATCLMPVQEFCIYSAWQHAVTPGGYYPAPPSLGDFAVCLRVWVCWHRNNRSSLHCKKIFLCFCYFQRMQTKIFHIVFYD